MAATLAAAALLLPCGPGRAAQDPASTAAPRSFDDHGTYVLSVAGRVYGTEKFSIRSLNDQVEAEADIELREDATGRAASTESFPKLILDSALNPRTYLWSLKGPKNYSLVVDFTGELAKTQLHRPDGKDDVREFQLQKDVVVLDNNVIHHYQILVDRFFQTAGGKQAFQAYIPQDAVPGLLTVQDAGMESVNFRGQEETLRHLVVLTDNAEMDLWVDAEQRLQRVLHAANKVEAVRQP